MSTELPLYRQEKRNTCALAYLRMVLAAYGTDVFGKSLHRLFKARGYIETASESGQ